jgi:hypothetical protein
MKCLYERQCPHYEDCSEIDDVETCEHLAEYLLLDDKMIAHSTENEHITRISVPMSEGLIEKIRFEGGL